jgi:hypothetical protein
MNCSSLITIKIPSNVRAIENSAFRGCTSLTNVELSEDIQTIQQASFNNCSSLLQITIPPSVTTINIEAFYGCTSLREIFLNEGLQTIEDGAFSECSTLLGIKIPSTVSFISGDAFRGFSLLRNVSISPASNNLTPEFLFRALSNMGVTLDMIMQRFDELPLHKFCFDYQPIYDKKVRDNSSHVDFNHHVARLPSHGLQQDCLGMTPLHILACSYNRQGVEIYKCIIEKCPNALVTEDRWGDFPLTYALYAQASMEVIHFLFKTHRQMWGNLPFDFGNMIQELVENFGTSAEYVRNVIRAQRVHFPALVVDWLGIVNDYGDLEGPGNIPLRLFANYMPSDIGKFRVLIEASVSSRNICMSEEHQFIIDARLREIRNDFMNTDVDIMNEDVGIEMDEETIIGYYEEIRVMVTDYAHRHHEHLTEATTILELALWKAMILRSSGDKQGLTRAECRTGAGRCAEVVIKLVLAFL